MYLNLALVQISFYLRGANIFEPFTWKACDCKKWGDYWHKCIIILLFDDNKLD